MNEEIMFSILVPVYNVMDYIDECIQSVLAQTYTNYELVLVDDGSTDRSGEIIDRYADQYAQIKAFHKENKGQFHTRRYAIEHACGAYYVMLDSDDMLEKNCLEVLYTNIIKHNCDCVFFNRKKLIDGKIRRSTYHIREEYVAGNNDVVRKALVEVPYNSVCLKCAKAGMYTNQGYTQYYHIRRGEDALQSLELLSHCNSAEFIDDELYIYRQRPGSICNPVHQTDYQVDLTVRKVCLQFIRERKCFSEDDMNQYRDKYIAFYIREILFIGSLNMTTAKKKEIYKELREDEYYRDFLSKGVTDKKRIGYRIIIWYLFRMKCDYLLAKMISIYQKLIIDRK